MEPAVVCGEIVMPPSTGASPWVRAADLSFEEFSRPSMVGGSGCYCSAVPKAPARPRQHRRRQLARVPVTVTKAHPDRTSSLARETDKLPGAYVQAATAGAGMAVARAMASLTLLLKSDHQVAGSARSSG